VPLCQVTRMPIAVRAVATNPINVAVIFG
jgi:hypothetical protein